LSTQVLSLGLASAGVTGALSGTDWSTFNSKQNALTLTTTGTSGAATLVGSTLNIPQYQAAGTYVTAVTASSPLASSGGTTPNITIQQASGSQNGFLSSTDWTTFNNKQNALTNPVTGTGTTNYLPKFTGTSTIGNSSLFDGGGFGGFNSTGINARTFVINAASGRPLALELFEFANVHSVFVRPNNSGFNLISSNYISGGVYLPLSLSGRENNADLVLQTSGNVTIGTTTDAGFKLDVNGTGRFSDLLTTTYGTARVQVTSTTNSANSAFRLGAKDSAGTTKNAGLYYVAGTTTATTFLSFAADDNNYQFNVLANGNVGIGTTSPSTALHVVSNDNSANRTSPYNVATITATSANAPYNGFGTGLVFAATHYNGIVYNGARIRTVLNDNSIVSLGNSIAFDVTATRGSTLTEAMKIDYNGNVGIGTSSPVSRLSVGGNGYSGRAITAIANNADYAITFQQDNSSGAGLQIFTTATTWGSFPLNISDGTSTQLRITSGGNLLVGTTTDNGQRLQVSGSATIGGNLTISSGNNLNVVTGDIHFQSNAGYGILSPNANRLVSIQNGAFGVSGAATFSSSVTAVSLRSVDPANTFSATFGANSSTPNWVAVGTISGVPSINGYNNTFSATTNLALQPNGGNVGIGTSSPNSRLHVAGDFRTVLTSGVGGDTLIAAISGVSNGYIINVDTSNNITHTWNTGANAAALRITPGGNVLIGTTTDVGAKLYVNGGIRTANPTGSTSNDWLLGRALTSGTSSPDRWIRVQIGNLYYDILAVYMGSV
jgi:hypothetical protein